MQGPEKHSSSCLSPLSMLIPLWRWMNVLYWVRMAVLEHTEGDLTLMQAKACMHERLCSSLQTNTLVIGQGGVCGVHAQRSPATPAIGATLFDLSQAQSRLVCVASQPAMCEQLR